ncbi:MAG: YfhO family protein [Lachnospiraceae bacterium]|nr:YfhO family protein [Lachnospiraceae bacterium]
MKSNLESLIKKIMIAALVVGAWIYLVVVIANYKVDNLYPLFAEEKYITNIEAANLVAINDVEVHEEKYTIAGDDAYVVYTTEIPYMRGIRIQFQAPFEQSGRIQIFYAKPGEVFSQDDSITTIIEEGQSEIEIETELSDIISMRIDVMMPVDTEFEIVEVQVDGSETGYLKILFNQYTFIYLILIIALYLINRKWDILNNKKISSKIIILGGWILTVAFTYLLVVLSEYDISTTNVMYRFYPWSTSLVDIEGPPLSDPIDSALPNIYNAYYGSGFHFWNGEIAFGVPIGVEVYLNPFNWFYFLPVKYAILWKSIFELSVAYFGMVYLLKRLKLGLDAQVVGGISFALSSSMIMWLFWPHTDVMMWAPLAMAMGNKLIEEYKLKDMFLMALIVFFMLVAEMPTYAAYIIYLLGFYIFFISIYQYRKTIKRIIQVYCLFAGSIVLGVVAAFPYLESLLSTVGSNGYADNRISQGKTILSFSYLRTLFLPYLGWDSSRLHMNEYTLYIGAGALIFLLFGLVRFKEKKKYFWIVSLVTLAILVYTHILDFVYVHMPEVNTSRKTRLVSLIGLVAVVIAVTNYDDILKKPQEYRKALKGVYRWIVYAISILAGIVVYYKYREETGWALGSLVSICFLVVALECIIRNTGVLTGIAKIVVFLVIMTNMGIFARRYLPMIEDGADIIPTATDSVEFLQENLNEARVFPISESGWLFFPNSNVFYGIKSITAHSFINTYENMNNYMKSIDDSLAISPTAFHAHKVDNVNLLKYGGVKYIIKIAGDPCYEITEGQCVFSGNDDVEVYELEEYAPRFYLGERVVQTDTEKEILDSMKQEYEENTVYILAGQIENISLGNSELQDDEKVSVEEDQEDYIKISARTEEERILVFNEYNDGNWTAIIDGQEANVLSINYLFSGIVLHKGEHTVEFVYDASKQKILLAIAISALSVIFVGFLTTAILEQRKKKLRREENQ